MSEIRRDKKGRRLERGETQDKEGRYIYSYNDAFKKRRTVKSWRLVESDSLPKGKRPCKPLRELEKEVQAELFKGIGNNHITVLELVDIYLGTLTGLKQSSKSNHKWVRNVIASEAFGHYLIKKVNVDNAQTFLIHLQKEEGRGYSSVHSIRGVLRPAFQKAVENDMLLKNPFEFELAKVVINDSVRREAIEPAEERAFLKFVKEDSHFCRYYDGIYILFKTGMRISEFCGLTLNDIDLKNGTIDINHQLQRHSDMRYEVLSTKTNAGTRVLPMDKGVREAFERIIKNRGIPKTEPMIDGYIGFLFLDKNGMPMVALHWEKYFQHICQKYNRIYKVQMPKVTPHVCRHTYCSNMARKGMNPKTLQYLMGHSDICITFNTYTHLGLADAKKEMDRIAKETKEVRENLWKNRRKKCE